MKSAILLATATLTLSACVAPDHGHPYPHHPYPQDVYQGQPSGQAPAPYYGDHYDDDYIEAQVRRDPNYPEIRQRAIRILQSQGYTRIKDIDVDTFNGRPVLEFEAHKGYQEFDIKMSYPDLRIISQTPD